jgi:hypothetical protein
VLAADNALPHLLSEQGSRRGAASDRAQARAGLFIASIRDYDEALACRPDTWPARLLGEEGRRRIVQQV